MVNAAGFRAWPHSRRAAAFGGSGKSELGVGVAVRTHRIEVPQAFASPGHVPVNGPGIGKQNILTTSLWVVVFTPRPGTLAGAARSASQFSPEIFDVSQYSASCVS